MEHIDISVHFAQKKSNQTIRKRSFGSIFNLLIFLQCGYGLLLFSA